MLLATLAVLVGYVVVVCTAWAIRQVRMVALERGITRRGPQAEFYDRYCRALRSLGLLLAYFIWAEWTRGRLFDPLKRLTGWPGTGART